jgi:uncharacterized protein (TIGR02421 family)
MMGAESKAGKSSELIQFTSLDARLVSAAAKIKVLSSLAWPQETCDIFLSQWKNGNPAVPRVDYSPVDHREAVIELGSVMKACDRSHPIANYIYVTAESYVHAALLLSRRGTAAFTESSMAIYGKPKDKMVHTEFNHLEAANYFLEYTKSVASTLSTQLTNQPDYCISAETVADEIRLALAPYFKEKPVEVVIDPHLESKAAASANRVRIRGGTCFTERDVGQLTQHEALVHTLSMYNGRHQKNLKSFGLGSPRTTRTQEGLAIFSELITGTIDIARFMRLALRIVGVQHALDGADFIQVFKFFLEATGDERESFHSAVRIFRGGDPKQGGVFTKDVVYLQGLIYVHTFLRKAMQTDKFNYPTCLFSGRLSLSDVVLLQPWFDSGFISPPVFEPPWLARRECLAAYLCYSIFANKISLGEVQLSDFAHA